MLTWLLGTKFGRYVTAAVALVVLIAGAAWRVFAAGRASAAAKQKETSLENLRERATTDDAINQLSDTTRRHHLREWVRDDER